MKSLLFHRAFLFGLMAILTSFTAYSQQELSGVVVGKIDGDTIPGVHIVNIGTQKHTESDAFGRFSIDVYPGDTIVFAHMSFRFTYFHIPAELSGDLSVSIEMELKNYLLNEVSVVSYQLSTNNPRAMPIGKPRVPVEEEIRYPVQPATAPGISNPADMLYYYFGNRPKQMRELARLQAEDAYRTRLRESHNREILMEITELDEEELEAIAFYCKYERRIIQDWSDYQLLITLLDCYRNYRENQAKQGIINEEFNYWD